MVVIGYNSVHCLDLLDVLNVEFQQFTLISSAGNAKSVQVFLYA